MRWDEADFPERSMDVVFLEEPPPVKSGRSVHEDPLQYIPACGENTDLCHFPCVFRSPSSYRQGSLSRAS